jgi:cytochrome c-type biogenesis protein CcmH
MTTRRIVILVALVAIAATVAWSARPQPETQAERVDRITAQLRCVVCQGLSVKDSPAESARQMREIVVERVAEGRSDEEIFAEFRSSFGDWVILSPPLFAWTGLVWLVPAASLLIGLVLAARWMRPAPRPHAEPSAADLATLRERVAREEEAEG